MSETIGDSPSIKEIADIVEDIAPHSMSELRGVNFTSGNSPTTGSLSLGDFRNKTLKRFFDGDHVKITASSDGAQNDQFGYSVSISGDGSVVIVGAYGDDSYTGSAYIYEKVNGTWTQKAKLTTDGGAQNDRFGQSVSISGDGSVVIVGAYGDDNNTGSVYIYEKPGSTWSSMTRETAKLTASGGRFGFSVSISGDGATALVGAYVEYVTYQEQGSAYIFENVNGSWTQRAKLTANNGARYDYFGRSVSISSDGSTALIGADGAGRGAAYVFVKGTGWSNMTETAKLTESEGGANRIYSSFAQCVYISGDGSTAIIGETARINSQGAAYIYEKGSGWSSMTETARLTASDAINYVYFGRAVSISSDGSMAIVGAYVSNDGKGSAYIFEKGSGWSNMTETVKFLASDGVASDQFGWSVAISGDGVNALVGAYGDDDNGTDSGSAYIFESTYFTN